MENFAPVFERLDELRAHEEEQQRLKQELKLVEDYRNLLRRQLGLDEQPNSYTDYASSFSADHQAEIKAWREEREAEAKEKIFGFIDTINLNSGDIVTSQRIHDVDLDLAGGFDEQFTYTLLVTNLGILFERRYEVINDASVSGHSGKGVTTHLFAHGVETPLEAEGKRISQITDQSTGQVDLHHFHIGRWERLQLDMAEAQRSVMVDLITYEVSELLEKAPLEDGRWSGSKHRRIRICDEGGNMWTLAIIYWSESKGLTNVIIRHELEDEVIQGSTIDFREKWFRNADFRAPAQTFEEGFAHFKGLLETFKTVKKAFDVQDITIDY